MANIPGFSGYKGWGQAEAEADFRATGGSGKEDWRDFPSGGGGGGGGSGKDPNYPQFAFDWEAAEREALEKLRPYYEEKLKETKGDVELAKKRIEDDYVTEKRFREEDLATELAEDKRLKEEEFRNTSTDLNRRGILFGEIPSDSGLPAPSAAPYGDIAQRFFLNPMTEKQAARKQAIEKAYGRKQEIAETTKKRGVEDIDIAYPRYERELGEEKKEKAIVQMAPLKYQQEHGKYQALLSKYMQGG